MAKTGLTQATVNKALEHLGHLGKVKELTNMKQNWLFSGGNLALMNQCMEVQDAAMVATFLVQ